MKDVLARINEFGEFARRRANGTLTPNERAEMDALRAQLQELLDGGNEPLRPGAPAPRVPTRPSQVSPPITLSARDEGILRTLQASRIPRSSYTPPAASPFLMDYYPEGAKPVPDSSALPPPSRLATMATDDLEQPPTAMSYFLVTNSIPPTAAPSTSIPPSASPSSMVSQPPTSSVLPQAVVHLVDGAPRRGELVLFDEEQSVIILRRHGTDERHPFLSVLALFVGTLRDVTPRSQSGVRLFVTLTTDKVLAGASPNYAPGRTSMTLIPDDQRSVDWIWIPASAVKEIRQRS